MLESLLPASVFAVLLVFCRIGTALMLLPAFGESFVAMRHRVLFALALALVVTPLVLDRLPGMPASAAMLFVLLMGEIFVGLFLGVLAKIMMTALIVAGMVIAYMSTLANALVNDPLAQQQGSIAGSFLNICALVLIFALNLHHLLINALVESYGLFLPGSPPLAGDLSETVVRTVSQSFQLGVQMAAPFVAVGLIFYLGVGLLARLMPQVQIFFVALPLQISAGLIVLLVVLPTILMWFIGRFEAAYIGFLLS